MVGSTILPGCFFDYMGYILVMDMANVRQQVMFHLVIQSSNYPGKKPAPGRKVSGCGQLM